MNINNNSAISDGGGIYCAYSNPIVTNVTIINNSAPGGGGIRCDDSSPTLTNVTIMNNSASNGGGIISSIKGVRESSFDQLYNASKVNIKSIINKR